MHNLEDTRSGLSMIDVMGKLPASAGFDIDHEADGTAVKTVDDLSSAFLSGLKPGDEIVRFNGTKRTGEQIGKILDNVRFGDLLTVAVLREGEERVFRFHAE